MTVLPDRIARSGAELVGLAEHFYRRAFAGALVFVGLAAAAALALLPLRDSVSQVTLTTPTVALAAVLVLAAPLAAWRSQDVYRLLRRDPRFEAVPVVLSAAMIAYPLRSELWWPACALLMLLAIVAPLARTLAYCLLVLLVNLAAHAVSGDLDETPAVAIIGLWIGFFFWSLTAGVFSDRIAAYLLRLDVARAAARPPAPERVVDDGMVTETARLALAPPVPEPDAAEELQRLTARQLEVVALLADGLRYQEVAACLSISARQVQRHVAQAVSRLGVRNANELVAVAVAAGFVPPRA